MNSHRAAKDVPGFIAHLVERSLLADMMAQRVLSAIEATGHAPDTVMTELGLMREEVYAREVADFMGIEFVKDPAARAKLDDSVAPDFDFLALRSIVPLKGIDGDDAIRVAVADPFERDSLAMLEYHWERPVEPAVAVRSALASLLAQAVKRDEPSADTDVGVYEGDLERLREFAQQAPVVRLVAKVAQGAFDAGATDIHFEPFEHSVRVRVRVDGDLRTVETVPIGLLPGIATRVKILAGLDISERRLPQDGRLRLAVRGQDIDLRVSIVPSIHGETIVLRILDRSTVALDLRALGFDPEACDRLGRLARLPNGVFLVTGPTGSGKTTTLYALVALLNQPGVKIFTVEDPVEYRMEGITQVQTNAATGLTFARALRSVLRQDPDIILIGEIRDRETAEIAMQAALTGHLVLSTLHTNSAAGAVTRLRDMGIESYLIAATLKCVLGQRLLRKSCACGAAAPGCPACGGSGFKGRTVSFETLEVTPEVAGTISAGASEDVIVGKARGFVSMENQALSLVQDEVTTLEEVARAIRLTGSDDA